jgi:hypothetical protein
MTLRQKDRHSVGNGSAFASHLGKGVPHPVESPEGPLAQCEVVVD